VKFAPGVSGNPGGRPKVAKEVRKLAQDNALAAIKTLIALMEGADKDSTRGNAARVVLQVAGVPMGEETGEVADRPTPGNGASWSLDALTADLTSQGDA
jgi:hypothetical protein